jgi:hypothetical protein
LVYVVVRERGRGPIGREGARRHAYLARREEEVTVGVSVEQRHDCEAAALGDAAEVDRDEEVRVGIVCKLLLQQTLACFSKLCDRFRVRVRG